MKVPGLVIARSMKELSPVLIVSWTWIVSTLGRSYPRFNYRYQVTCSSFRVPEQLTLLRVHRMQMTSRPSVRPSIRLSVHPFLVRQGGREGGLLDSHQTLAKRCLLSQLSILRSHIK